MENRAKMCSIATRLSADRPRMRGEVASRTIITAVPLHLLRNNDAERMCLPRQLRSSRY